MTDNPSKKDGDDSLNESENSASNHSNKLVGNIFHSDNFDVEPTTLLVTFKEGSQSYPGNWSQRKKILHTVLYGCTTFAAQLNSTTMSSPRLPQLLHLEFGMSSEVSVLGSTLYILGIGFGPMVFAPISEVYGRKVGVLIPFFCAAIFSFATATCYNTPSLMIYRFLSGFCCGAPIVSSGGVLADIFPNPGTRGKYFALYALFVSLGPSAGPVISSLLMYSEEKTAAWRIPQYFSGLINIALFVSGEIFLDETYSPVILAKEARKLRLASKQWGIHCDHDKWQLTFNDVVQIHLIRPVRMLFTPIVFVIVLFASYVYGVLFIIITTLPLAFKLTRDWEGTISTLPNLALFVGTLSGCLVNLFWANQYSKRIKSKNNGKAIPEERFPVMMALGWFMPIGIIIFAWTSNKKYHWIIPCLGIYLVGIGFIVTFQGCLNYLVDTYTRYAASTIAANTFLRSVFAAGFPLFSRQLFVNLGVDWGATLIGLIGLGMIPIPFIFYKYGGKIRAKNPFKAV